MKFEIGDRVRVKSIEWYNENKDCDGRIITDKELVFNENMSELCGGMFTIKRKTSRYEFYESHWLFQDWMLEDDVVTDEQLLSTCAPQKTNVELFIDKTATLNKLYERKNADYGNSYEESLDEDGLLVAKIRLSDKFKRFSTLIKQDAKVKDESIIDTLEDMASYALMTAMWIEKHK